MLPTEKHSKIFKYEVDVLPRSGRSLLEARIANKVSQRSKRTSRKADATHTSADEDRSASLPTAGCSQGSGTVAGSGSKDRHRYAFTSQTGTASITPPRLLEYITRYESETNTGLNNGKLPPVLDTKHPKSTYVHKSKSESWSVINPVSENVNHQTSVVSRPGPRFSNTQIVDKDEFGGESTKHKSLSEDNIHTRFSHKAQSKVDIKEIATRDTSKPFLVPVYETDARHGEKTMTEADKHTTHSLVDSVEEDNHQLESSKVEESDEQAKILSCASSNKCCVAEVHMETACDESLEAVFECKLPEPVRTPDESTDEATNASEDDTKQACHDIEAKDEYLQPLNNVFKAKADPDTADDVHGVEEDLLPKSDSENTAEYLLQKPNSKHTADTDTGDVNVSQSVLEADPATPSSIPASEAIIHDNCPSTPDVASCSSSSYISGAESTRMGHDNIPTPLYKTTRSEWQVRDHDPIEKREIKSNATQCDDPNTVQLPKTKQQESRTTDDSGVQVEKEVDKDRLFPRSQDYTCKYYKEGSTMPYKVIERKTVYFDEKPKQVQASPSGVERKPKVTERKTVYPDEKPKTVQASPAGTNRKPKTVQASPSGNNRKPKTVQASSSGNDRKPKTVQASPSGNNRKPKPVQASPSGNNRKPKMVQASSSGNNRKPKTIQASPLGNDRKPKTVQASPSGNNRKPKTVQASPSGNNRKPKTIPASPSGNNRKPKTVQASPSGNDRKPKTVQASPSGNDRKPKVTVRKIVYFDEKPKTVQASPSGNDRKPKVTERKTVYPDEKPKTVQASPSGNDRKPKVTERKTVYPDEKPKTVQASPSGNDRKPKVIGKKTNGSNQSPRIQSEKTTVFDINQRKTKLGTPDFDNNSRDSKKIRTESLHDKTLNGTRTETEVFDPKPTHIENKTAKLGKGSSDVEGKTAVLDNDLRGIEEKREIFYEKPKVKKSVVFDDVPKVIRYKVPEFEKKLQETGKKTLKKAKVTAKKPEVKHKSKFVKDESNAHKISNQDRGGSGKCRANPRQIKYCGDVRRKVAKRLTGGKSLEAIYGRKLAPAKTPSYQKVKKVPKLLTPVNAARSTSRLAKYADEELNEKPLMRTNLPAWKDVQVKLNKTHQLRELRSKNAKNAYSAADNMQVSKQKQMNKISPLNAYSSTTHVQEASRSTATKQMKEVKMNKAQRVRAQALKAAYAKVEPTNLDIKYSRFTREMHATGHSIARSSVQQSRNIQKTTGSTCPRTKQTPSSSQRSKTKLYTSPYAKQLNIPKQSSSQSNNKATHPGNVMGQKIIKDDADRMDTNNICQPLNRPNITQPCGKNSAPPVCQKLQVHPYSSRSCIEKENPNNASSPQRSSSSNVTSPPLEHGSSSVENMCSSVRSTSVIIDGNVTSGDGNVTSGDGNVTSCDGNVTSGDGNVTSGDGNVTSSDGTSGDGNVTSGDGNVTSGDGNVTSSDGNVTSDDGNVTSSGSLESSDKQSDKSKRYSDEYTRRSTSRTTNDASLPSNSTSNTFDSPQTSSEDVAYYSNEITSHAKVLSFLEHQEQLILRPDQRVLGHVSPLPGIEEESLSSVSLGTVATLTSKPDLLAANDDGRQHSTNIVSTNQRERERSTTRTDLLVPGTSIFDYIPSPRSGKCLPKAANGLEMSSGSEQECVAIDVEKETTNDNKQPPPFGGRSKEYGVDELNKHVSCEVVDDLMVQTDSSCTFVPHAPRAPRHYPASPISEATRMRRWKSFLSKSTTNEVLLTEMPPTRDEELIYVSSGQDCSDTSISSYSRVIDVCDILLTDYTNTTIVKSIKPLATMEGNTDPDSAVSSNEELESCFVSISNQSVTFSNEPSPKKKRKKKPPLSLLNDHRYTCDVKNALRLLSIEDSDIETSGYHTSTKLGDKSNTPSTASGTQTPVSDRDVTIDVVAETDESSTDVSLLYTSSDVSLRSSLTSVASSNRSVPVPTTNSKPRLSPRSSLEYDTPSLVPRSFKY